MRYIDALGLINKAIKAELLQEEKGGVLVYRAKSVQSPEGWYLEEKDTVAKELMKDEAGQKMLMEALKEKGMEFVPTDYTLFCGFKNILSPNVE